MLTITIDDSAFRSHMQQLQARLGNLTPVMEAIGNRLENNVRLRFQIRTDPNGVPWKPWAESTLASYPWPGVNSMEGPGHGMLLDRYGTMLDSLNYQAGSTSVTVGFGQPYAVFHEWGTRKMPRRGMLTANPDQGTLGASDEAAVLDILSNWLAGAGQTG